MIPVVDPSNIDDLGKNAKKSQVTKFVGVFVDDVAVTYNGSETPPGHQNVYIRLMIGAGSGSTGEGGEDDEGLLKTLQLIE